MSFVGLEPRPISGFLGRPRSSSGLADKKNMSSSAKKLAPVAVVNAFPVDRREMGSADTLRYNVITYVVEENYDRAIHELKSYLEADSEYPRFRERIERYIAHAIDLVNAIRAKRKFPGAASLTMAKQQELNERFREHFNDLQGVLQRVEKIQVDLKLDDVRSTVWVVKASVNAIFAIVLMAFLLEAGRGLFVTFWTVMDDYFMAATDFIFNYLKL